MSTSDRLSVALLGRVEVKVLFPDNTNNGSINMCAQLNKNKMCLFSIFTASSHSASTVGPYWTQTTPSTMILMLN